MSTFSCPVVRVESVENHPNADRLSIVRLEGLGYTCISGKLEDGSHRYKAGDWCVYIPSAAVLPEWLLKEMDFWDAESGKGTLAGADGNRVKPLKLRGIFSEGVLFPVGKHVFQDLSGLFPEMPATPPHQVGWPDMKTRSEPTGITNWKFSIRLADGNLQQVVEGDDAAEHLGVTKYEPPIPTHMAGEVANLFGYTVKYDFERVQSVPDMFVQGERVTAYEKLHGTFTAIVFVPNLNHPEMFGSRGEIVVHSKGLGAQGLAFKNVTTNSSNLYVRMLNKLLADGFEDRLRRLSNIHGGARIAVLGETYGAGVQDLHYGTKEPQFRVFDLKIGEEFATPDYFEVDVGGVLKLDIVPKVYEGPYDADTLLQHSTGNTRLGEGNIREGIVIRSSLEASHPIHGRKIAKLINEAYLTRKSKEATEFQ